MDNKSLEILNRYFLSTTSDFSTIGASGQEFPQLLFKQNNKTYVIAEVSPPYFVFYVNTSTDFITVGFDLGNNAQGSFNDGDQVFVYATSTLGIEGTLPGGLSSTSPYYIVNATPDGTQMQLSSTFGGAAINITSGGVGKLLIQYF